VQIVDTNWAAVDNYANDLFAPPDPVLQDVLDYCDREGLPRIQVSPNHGCFLQLLARLRGARSILELGTLGGYSTIWVARALPERGKLISLERDPHNADVARRNIALAGLSGKVEVRVGDAQYTLAQMLEEGAGPFDMVFIDADKPGYPSYLPPVLKLCGPGALIVADNVVRGGALADPATTDPRVLGVRRFSEMAARSPGVSGTILQTVGGRGYDGFANLLVE